MDISIHSIHPHAEFSEHIFEELIDNDLLDYIFKFLYQDKIATSHINASLLVNRRWNSLYHHPLCSFIHSNITSYVIKNPPFNYLNMWQLNCLNQRQNLNQLINKMDKDPSIHQYFLESILFLFPFDIQTACKNDSINAIFNKLKNLEIRFYDPIKDGWKIIHLLNDQQLNLLIKYNYIRISQILTCRLNHEICEYAVQKNSLDIQFVPDHLKTEKICQLVVQRNGLALKYLLDILENQLAIQSNGENFPYVLKPLNKEEICQIAVNQNGLALCYVPNHLKTEKICRLAIQQNGLALNYIPNDLKTEKICQLAVQQNGLALNYIPNDLSTEEICQLAVQQNGLALDYVPKSLQTEKCVN